MGWKWWALPARVDMGPHCLSLTVWRWSISQCSHQWTRKYIIPAFLGSLRSLMEAAVLRLSLAQGTPTPRASPRCHAPHCLHRFFCLLLARSSPFRSPQLLSHPCSLRFLWSFPISSPKVSRWAGELIAPHVHVAVDVVWPVPSLRCPVGFSYLRKIGHWSVILEG